MKTKINASGFILLTLLDSGWNIFTLIDNKGRYDLPKGVIDEGESILEAAKRECFEESFIDVENREIVYKTWSDWDNNTEEYLRTKNKDKVYTDLAFYVGECCNNIVDYTKIMKNPLTNKKEHINIKLTTLDDFQKNAPRYLSKFIPELEKYLKSKLEKRGFNEREVQ